MASFVVPPEGDSDSISQPDRVVADADTQDLEVTGLDSETDGGWLIKGYVIAGSGGAANYTIQPDRLTTNQLGEMFLTGDGPAFDPGAQAGIGTTLPVANTVAARLAFTAYLWTKANRGSRLYTCTATRLSSANGSRIGIHAVGEVTLAGEAATWPRVRLHGSVSACIGAGSWIQVIKLGQEP